MRPAFPDTLTIPSSRGMPRRDSGLPVITRNTVGASGNVFESTPPREGTFRALFQNSRKLASSCCGLRPDTTQNQMVSEREVKREPQNSSIPVPCFQRGAGVLDHTGGTCSHKGMMDYPRFLISEMYLGKTPSLHGISKLESQLQDCCLLTMHWTKEVEIAKAIDELMTSRSIGGRTNRIFRASEEEQVSKSSVLRNTTNSHEASDSPR